MMETDRARPGEDQQSVKREIAAMDAWSRDFTRLLLKA